MWYARQRPRRRDMHKRNKPQRHGEHRGELSEKELAEKILGNRSPLVHFSPTRQVNKAGKQEKKGNPLPTFLPSLESLSSCVQGTGERLQNNGVPPSWEARRCWIGLNSAAAVTFSETKDPSLSLCPQRHASGAESLRQAMCPRRASPQAFLST